MIITNMPIITTINGIIINMKITINISSMTLRLQRKEKGSQKQTRIIGVPKINVGKRIDIIIEWTYRQQYDNINNFFERYPLYLSNIADSFT